ncbi:uncharacterized protein MKK02DRAFT_28663 [Dioszegia hungarica]|uniref:Uncharacterized protein n=1 Tax=Dioszegia hungarica TaxID=4972 RepID=A0AA38LSC0_9TREE|nr:uncharacterized protein MKK02DRAFT_28663 [Dioszegia hungarica]KAI9633915.1 hypothetical protein MKK02DRAFT_28663 [Dioszegia hungarica]
MKNTRAMQSTTLALAGTTMPSIRSSASRSSIALRREALTPSLQPFAFPVHEGGNRIQDTSVNMSIGDTHITYQYPSRGIPELKYGTCDIAVELDKLRRSQAVLQKTRLQSTEDSDKGTKERAALDGMLEYYADAISSVQKTFLPYSKFAEEGWQFIELHDAIKQAEPDVRDILTQAMEVLTNTMRDVKEAQTAYNILQGHHAKWSAGRTAAECSDESLACPPSSMQLSTSDDAKSRMIARIQTRSKRLSSMAIEDESAAGGVLAAIASLCP